MELLGTSAFVREDGKDFVRIQLSAKNNGETDAVIEPRIECTTALSNVPLLASSSSRVPAKAAATVAFTSPAVQRDQVAAFSCRLFYLGQGGNRTKNVDFLFIPGQPVMFADR